MYYIEHVAEKSNRMPNHCLYGSTSCCISHGPSQWETAIIDPPQLGDPSTNFRCLRRRVLSGQIASLTHESFCPFFPFFDTPTGRIFRHIPTLNTSLYVVSAKVVH